MVNADLRVEFTIDKSGGADIGVQLKATLDAARDDALLALEYYNDSYTKTTNNNYTGSASSMDQWTKQYHMHRWLHNIQELRSMHVRQIANIQTIITESTARTKKVWMQ